MKKVINFGERQRITVQDANPKSITGYIYLTASAVNTAIVPDVDWNQANADITLKQDGKNVVIYSGTLLPWIYEEAMIGRKGEDYALAEITLLSEDSAVTELGLMTFRLNFGTVINLDGDDQLNIELHFPNSFFGSSNTVAEASCYVQVTVDNGVGVQKFIPQIGYYVIPDAATRETIVIGDGVQRVVFINTETDAFTDALKKLSTVHFYSDRLNYTKEYYDLIAEQNFNPNLSEDTLYHRFPLCDVPVDQCRVELVLNSSLIDANQNYVFWRKYVTSNRMLNKAEAMETKHVLGALRKAE